MVNCIDAARHGKFSDIEIGPYSPPEKTKFSFWFFRMGMNISNVKRVLYTYLEKLAENSDRKLNFFTEQNVFMTLLTDLMFTLQHPLLVVRNAALLLNLFRP